jgi:catechol 2,3-dioxygenase-like lactoylglutathione lyase family enzyme
MMKQMAKFLGAPTLAAFLCCGAAFSQQPAAAASEAQPSPVTGLVPDHATLSVANMDQEVAFFERVLGFKVWHRMDTNPDNIGVQMRLPNYRIDLFQYKGSTRPAPVNPLYLQQGWIHVVFHVEDVALAKKQMEALHVPFTEAHDDKGVLIRLTFHDPEGNELEIGRNLFNMP